MTWPIALALVAIFVLGSAALVVAMLWFVIHEGQPRSEEAWALYISNRTGRAQRWARRDYAAWKKRQRKEHHGEGSRKGLSESGDASRASASGGGYRGVLSERSGGAHHHVVSARSDCADSSAPGLREGTAGSARSGGKSTEGEAVLGSSSPSGAETGADSASSQAPNGGGKRPDHSGPEEGEDFASFLERRGRELNI